MNQLNQILYAIQSEIDKAHTDERYHASCQYWQAAARDDIFAAGLTKAKQIISYQVNQQNSIEQVNQDLLEACQMSQDWIGNLIDAVGLDTVLDAMPNNCGGRIQLGKAIRAAAIKSEVTK